MQTLLESPKILAVILRPLPFGPRQSERAVISSIIRQVLDYNVKVIKVGNLETKRDFNYIKDTVDAFISLAEVNYKKIDFGSAYNTGTGKAVTINHVLKIIKITGTSKTIVQEKDLGQVNRSL